jgi:predicted membrane metal-binding protein
MPGSMLAPLLSMLAGFMLFFGAVLCMRLRGEVLNRERQAAWVREEVRS